MRRSLFLVGVVLLSLFTSISPSQSADTHQNGWTNLNWNTAALGKNGSLSQDFTPLRIDWPRGYQGWSFWYHIQYCWQKNLDYGSGNSCGYLGIGLHTDSNNQLIGNFDLAYSDAKDFRITSFDNQSQCERRDPSQNVKGTNYIVCWTGINIKRESTYRIRMFANQSLGDNWWTASLQDLDSGRILTLGNIQGLANDSSRPFSFVATHVGYGGSVAKCDSVPIADYLVGNLKINDVSQNSAGWNSASCTTSAINQSSKTENGFFMRTGGSVPSSRHYTNAAGTSLQSASPTPTPSSTELTVNRSKPSTPSFSLVNFTNNKMNIAVNLGNDSDIKPDRVYLVAPKLGISTNKPLSGTITGSVATWTLEFDKLLGGTPIPIEIISERAGFKSDSLNGSYVLPGVKCPAIIDITKSEKQPQVTGFLFTGTNQKFIKVNESNQIPVVGLSNLVGCYVEPSMLTKESPDWQIGAISRDSNGFYWTNGAGVSWRLKVVEGGTRLETDRSNPYYDQGKFFELNTIGSSTQTLVPAKPILIPAKPTNFKSRMMGDIAVVSVDSNQKKGAAVSEVYLTSSSLGITERKPLKGEVLGTKALIEVPIKISMLGKKYPVLIYFVNSKGKSPALNATLTIPSASKISSIGTPRPAQPKLPKTVICARTNQTRAFEGEICPPGWEKR